MTSETVYLNADALRALRGGDFLAHLGQDGMRWTKAFLTLNPDSNVDEGTLLGWFCNALCAGEDHGLARCGKIDPMWQRPWDRIRNTKHVESNRCGIHRGFGHD